MGRCPDDNSNSFQWIENFFYIYHLGQDLAWDWISASYLIKYAHTGRSCDLLIFGIHESIFHFCLGCYCGGYSQNGRSNLSSYASNRRNAIAPYRRILWGKSIGDQWIPMTNGQQCGRHFHSMLSPWYSCAQLVMPSFTMRPGYCALRNYHSPHPVSSVAWEWAIRDPGVSKGISLTHGGLKVKWWPFCRQLFKLFCSVKKNEFSSKSHLYIFPRVR